MNHTKGPWIIKHLANSRRDTVRIVEKANHYSVAEVRDAAFESQGYADAQLIAAAPDMLSALQECLAKLEGERDILKLTSNPRWLQLHAIAEKARQAIAKATGE
jgi:hypothetical protein